MVTNGETMVINNGETINNDACSINRSKETVGIVIMVKLWLVIMVNQWSIMVHQ